MASHKVAMASPDFAPGVIAAPPSYLTGLSKSRISLSIGAHSWTESIQAPDRFISAVRFSPELNISVSNRLI